MFKKMLFVLLTLSFALAACAPATATPEVMMEKPTEVMMEKSTETMMEKPTEAADGKMTAAPAWFGATLSDASTGNTFTINDFKGKVVLVETMAQWCPNCKQQQTQVKALHELLGMNKDLVSLSLDIDPNENLVDLKNYVTSNGFDWLYAVAPADVSREIGTLYGDNFLNPPSTPILVIDRKGESHPLPFGIKSADELKKFIEPFLQGGM